MTRIPTLDLAAAGGASGLAGPLANALADTGFCIVTGHGIDLALIREARRRVREKTAFWSTPATCWSCGAAAGSDPRRIGS